VLADSVTVYGRKRGCAGSGHRSTIFSTEGVSTMNKTLLSTAIGGVLALSALSMSVFAADDAATEKCYGVAKAGKNDCAGAGHACAGQSKADANAKEWIKLPAGTCERLVGGSLSPK
jgi:uncharacterized membrane protein